MGNVSCVLHAFNYNNKMSFVNYLYLGNGSFKDIRSNFNTTPSFNQIFPIDVNGDNLSDILQFYNNDSVLSFITYIAQGNGVFYPVSSNYPGYTISYKYIFPMEIDGDGKQDVLQIWNNNGYLNFISYISQGDGTYKIIPASSTQRFTIGTIIKYMDINGDGKTDLLQTAYYPKLHYMELISHLSKGDGTFTLMKSNFPISKIALLTLIYPIDINNDKMMDVLKLNYHSPGVIGNIFHYTFYVSTGNGIFKKLFDSYLEIKSGPLFPAAFTNNKHGFLQDSAPSTDMYYFCSYISQEEGSFFILNTTYKYNKSDLNVNGLLSFDINRDGISDILKLSNSNSNMVFYSYLAKDKGLFEEYVGSSYIEPYYGKIATNFETIFAMEC